MGETTKVLLMTRPAAQSAAFVARLEAAAGPIPHVISPLFEVRPTGAAVPAGADLVLTSGRAVEAVSPGVLAGRRVWCVGPATAELARLAGAKVAGTAADLAGLAALLAAARPAQLVHLHGSHRAGDLAGTAAAAGLQVDGVAVYESRDQALNRAAQTLLSGTAAILAPVFSPRSARRLAEAAGPALARLAVVAISPAAAAPVAGARRLEVAPRPDAAAMQAAVLTLWRDLP